MGSQTLRERIQEVEEFGVPHLIEPGNTLPTTKPLDKVAFLDGVTPEVRFNMDGYPDKMFGDTHPKEITPEMQEALSRVTGGEISPDKFQCPFYDVETRAFFDGKVTHYFLWPAKKLYSES
jgi:hypothetical protein